MAKRGRPPSGLKSCTVPLPPDLVAAAKRIAAAKRERGETCVYGDLVREGLAMRIAAEVEATRPSLFKQGETRMLVNLALVKCPPIGRRHDRRLFVGLKTGETIELEILRSEGTL